MAIHIWKYLPNLKKNHHDVIMKSNNKIRVIIQNQFVPEFTYFFDITCMLYTPYLNKGSLKQFVISNRPKDKLQPVISNLQIRSEFLQSKRVLHYSKPTRQNSSSIIASSCLHFNMLNFKDCAENVFPTGYFYEFKHIFHLAWPTVSIWAISYQLTKHISYCDKMLQLKLQGNL